MVNGDAAWRALMTAMLFLITRAQQICENAHLEVIRSVLFQSPLWVSERFMQEDVDDSVALLIFTPILDVLASRQSFQSHNLPITCRSPNLNLISTPNAKRDKLRPPACPALHLLRTPCPQNAFCTGPLPCMNPQSVYKLCPNWCATVKSM